ncbi:hypothetical protein CVS40_7884 [Lucilia cuprina]|nr:hypothetical protein CVS40_7884 [Lucilia cuprina]
MKISEYSNCSKEKHEFNEDLQFILMKSKNGQSKTFHVIPDLPFSLLGESHRYGKEENTKDISQRNKKLSRILSNLQQQWPEEDYETIRTL